MTPPDASPAAFSDRTDEALAGLCRDGIDGAERELLRRHMQAIYWLPKQAFGAPEDSLSDFLLFAVEKIRDRNILAKFDAGRGARFSTWFGVVIRNLYLDYLRARPDEPAALELLEPPRAMPEASAAAEPDPPSLLARMEARCRVLFKLLLCDTFALTPEDLAWIAETAGTSPLAAAGKIADLEEKLRRGEARLQERYEKLAAVHWWKTRYEKHLRELEHGTDRPWLEENAPLAQAYEKLARRREEYRRIERELAGGAGLVTAPYRDLADLLAMKEGTLASQISRCRAAAMAHLPEEA